VLQAADSPSQPVPVSHWAGHEGPGSAEQLADVAQVTWQAHESSHSMSSQASSPAQATVQRPLPQVMSPQALSPVQVISQSLSSQSMARQRSAPQVTLHFQPAGQEKRLQLSVRHSR
jgi:hypothetical protein